MGWRSSAAFLALGAVLVGCGTEEVWSCQNTGTALGLSATSASCESHWICEGPDFSGLVLDLKCSTVGEKVNCDCLANGRSVAAFSMERDECASNLAVEANDGCRWHV